jgi:hypothetical protein
MKSNIIFCNPDISVIEDALRKTNTLKQNHEKNYIAISLALNNK